MSTDDVQDAVTFDALAAENKRLRAALEVLATVSASDYTMFGSAGAALLADSVRKYARKVLDGKVGDDGQTE